MRSYSPFFQTLHDQPAPVGDIGRGAHYSILRSFAFQDCFGKPVLPAQYHDFAVVWDEDHDDRVIPIIEHVYRLGLLPRFVYFGERKGTLTAVLTHPLPDPTDVAELNKQLNSISQKQDDPWPTKVVTMHSEDNHIVHDRPDRAIHYLIHIQMLWHLGLKPVVPSEATINPAIYARLDRLPFYMPAYRRLKDRGMVYIGDLIQHSASDLGEIPGLGRLAREQVQEVLSSLNLSLGMDVPNWPPANIEELSQKYHSEVGAA